MYETNMYEGMLAETVTMPGANGDIINAYYARPMGPGPFPGIVVIHHMPGWDEWYREATRKFAHHVVNKLSLVEFNDTEISTALEHEESRRNCEFVSRKRDLIDVVGMFSRNIQLEAVLITHDGSSSNNLLGIITRTDVQEYLM